MAAADYYEPPLNMETSEEKLEIQSRHIDEKILLFQARLRGFLVRRKIPCSSEDGVAIQSTEHLASADMRVHYQSRHTKKIIYKSIEIEDRENDRSKEDIVSYHDSWYPVVPLNSASAYGELDNDYSKSDLDY